MFNSLVSIVPRPEMLALPTRFLKRSRPSMPDSPCSVKEPLLPVHCPEACCAPPKSQPQTQPQSRPLPPSQLASLQLDVSRCAPKYSPHQLRRMVYRLADANSYQTSASVSATPLPQHVVITLNADVQPPAQASKLALQKSVSNSWMFSHPMTLMFALVFTAFVAAFLCASSLLQ